MHKSNPVIPSVLIRISRPSFRHVHAEAAADGPDDDLSIAKFKKVKKI
jgi:hypothetical protein